MGLQDSVGDELWPASTGGLWQPGAHRADAFGNPASHPTPYKEILTWCDGWMPMVYFSEWTNAQGKPLTAVETLDYVLPQWLTLEQTNSANGVPKRAILPLISVDHTPQKSEIVVWCQQTEQLGYLYCGFWYNEPFGRYAESVGGSFTRQPKVTVLPEQPTQVMASVTPVPIAHPELASGPVIGPLVISNGPPQVKVKEDSGPVLIQDVPAVASDPLAHTGLAETELQATWHAVNSSLLWESDSPICRYWSSLLQEASLVYPGPPIGAVVSITIDGIPLQVLRCRYGRAIIYNAATGHLWVS